MLEHTPVLLLHPQQESVYHEHSHPHPLNVRPRLPVSMTHSRSVSTVRRFLFCSTFMNTGLNTAPEGKIGECENVFFAAEKLEDNVDNDIIRKARGLGTRTPRRKTIPCPRSWPRSVLPPRSFQLRRRLASASWSWRVQQRKRHETKHDKIITDTRVWLFAIRTSRASRVPCDRYRASKGKWRII